MTVEQELEALRRAIMDWAKAQTYEEGCTRWSRVARLAGINQEMNK